MSETPLLDPAEVAAGLHVLSGDPDAPAGFTLSTLGHNEMFFLPVFLDHYRALGVERFVILDDSSDDDSRAFLSDQPDVILMGSDHRYGDKVRPPEDGVARGRDFRANSIWRGALLDRFGTEAWSLHVDLDEFIHLPPGLTFPDLAARLDPAEGEVVWAAWLEAYPATLADMAAARADPHLDLSRDWYFDARQVLELMGQGAPQRKYKGMMARILTQYGLHPVKGARAQLRWWLKQQPPTFNMLQKPPLLYWRAGDVFQSSHTIKKPARPDMMLPMLHYKFTGALYDKLAYALESGAYFEGSRKYHLMEDLLRRMDAGGGRLTGRASRRITGWADLKASGNTRGLE